MEMSQFISHEYLVGISEARSLSKVHQREYGALSLHDARSFLANADACCGMGFSKPMQDMVRGERDFWRLQVKRLAEARAAEVLA